MNERQTAIFQVAEVRAVPSEGETRKLAGYAALFDTLSVDLWGFREEIAPGAFAGSLQGDIRALWQHDTTRPLARSKNGTLRLWEDQRGLAFEMAMPDTQLGRDAFADVASGLVDSMSFGFRVLPDGEQWRLMADQLVVRRLVRVELMEVSPVTWAAYPQTSVGARAAAAFGEPVIIPDWVRGRAAQPVEDSGEGETRARLADLRKRQRETLKILTGG